MNNLKPFNRCCLENFPFIEEDFDALTSYEMYCKIVEYLNKMANFINVEVTDFITDYINRRFNEIMIDTMYESDTETLILYLNNGDVSPNGN